MNNLPPPSAFTIDQNDPNKWPKWRKKFENYIIASDLNSKTIQQQRAILLHIIGDSALEIYNTFGFEENAQSPTIKDILDKYDQYFRPFKNTIYKRYIFFTCEQKLNQTFDDFVTEIKSKAEDCEFENIKDSLIRDRIVLGCRDTTLREKYLQNPDLTLSLAINQGQAAEASQKQLRNIEKDSIDAIRKNSNERYKPTTSLKNSYTSNPVRANFNKSIMCSKCNMAHDFGKCPAYGKECYKCRQPNHFANCCKNRAIRCIQEIEEEKDNLLIIDSIMVGQVLRKPWKELIYIQGHPVDIKLDTGADVNILLESLIKEWPNMPLLETADCRIYTYTGQHIPVVGKCLLDCKTKYACRKVTFLIVNNSAVPILGLDECVKLNLVKRVETISDISVTLTGLLDEYKDVFKGNGHLSYMYDIKISDKAEPKICPARRLPRALLQPVKEELFKMEEDGIIEKIEEPTVWAHPMVVVKKPSGKYRILDEWPGQRPGCIDPRELNKWVLREHYTLPAPENILSEIPKAKFYSVLDAKSAFWQVPLSENTSKYLVMSTPFGRYRFLRLPFGISLAPENFQKIMHKIFCDIPNVVCYIDDLLIWDHNSTLKKVLDLARESRLKLTLNKLQMATGEAKFLGHTISQEGILPDQDKVRAIQNMQIPKNKQELQRILGTVTYLAKFIPDLSLLGQIFHQTRPNKDVNIYII
ncbi:K02A2.6-like [Cordylochernes scorpioides]|uniref:K02A2.6-like n=1 Tax=Cordylochernes scorpioides TaxID=51811 RepID=A0ABY6KVN4_9ARAC|nr:K02A2.6-like [Cordylochernes scorpioides]